MSSYTRCCRSFSFAGLVLFSFFFVEMSSAQTTQTEFVPQWAKSAVWYQIFPERFRNGDSSNDPKVADIAGADPMDPPKQWRVHPWGSDWYQL